MKLPELLDIAGLFTSDLFDGVLRKRVYTEGNMLVSAITQPSEDAILRDNAELRKNPGALRKLEAMEWALQIPTLNYHALVKANPLLTHTDAHIRTAAWKAFIASPASEPFRVRHQKWRV